jgi:hypothetical protein
MRVLLTGAALLLTRARLIAESRRRGQQSDRREEHDKTLDSLHTFHLLSNHEVDDTSRTGIQVHPALW